MERYFYYRDADIFCHHTLDTAPRTEDYSMHVHESFELYYFICGDASYLVEGTEYELRPHDVLLMRGSETHKTKINSAAPYERAAIHFSPAIFSALDPDGTLLMPFTKHQLGQNNRYSEDDFLSGRYKECFSDLDARRRETENRLFIISRMLVILTELQYAYRAKTDAGAIEHPGPASEIVSYINLHLFEEMSLDSISRRFYLSKSQLNRVFSRATGSPVWEYVRIKRLLAARERLLAGESAVNVCTECGFKDYSSFFRAYKARFGQSPSSERQK